MFGTAESFIATGGTDVLVVRSTEGEELLLPFCSEICRRIDLDEGTIEVEAPEETVGPECELTSSPSSRKCSGKCSTSASCAAPARQDVVDVHVHDLRELHDRQAPVDG